MTIIWSFPYNSFVKFHGKSNWEPQHDQFVWGWGGGEGGGGDIIKGLQCNRLPIINCEIVQPSHEILVFMSMLIIQKCKKSKLYSTYIYILCVCKKQRLGEHRFR